MIEGTKISIIQLLFVIQLRKSGQPVSHLCVLICTDYPVVDKIFYALYIVDNRVWV